MITREEFHTVSAEGLANPRAARYLVTPLSQGPEPFGFRQGDRHVPAVVLQFAVENLYDEDVKRVISLAYYQGGFALWCADKFTQGDIAPAEAGERIREVASQVPAAYAHRVQNALMTKYGSYRHRAPCHFWKAWHGHRGVCKHVGAVLQYVNMYRPGGIDQALTELQSAYEFMMAPPPVFLAQAADTTVEVPRYKLPTLPSDIANMFDTELNPDEQYVLWLKNGHTITAKWDEDTDEFIDGERTIAKVFIQAWARSLVSLTRTQPAGA